MPATTAPYRSTPPPGAVDTPERRRGAAGGSCRQRLPIVLLLLGWTIATGAHWDVIQVAAWGAMLARNAQVQPLTAALVTTFSPDGMCGVCHTVQAAKLGQNDNSLPAAKVPEKALLLLPSAHRVVVDHPASIGTAVCSETPPPRCWRAAPPVPPPRMA